MHITIYSKPNCTHCVQAKHLLKTKDLPFTEVELNFGQPVRENLMVEIAEFKNLYPSVSTMPFIIVDGNEIGGFTQLKALLA